MPITRIREGQMTKLIIYTFAVFYTIHGHSFSLVASNLEANYNNPSGIIIADLLSIETDDLGFVQENLIADLELKDETLHLKTPTMSFSFKDEIKDFFAEKNRLVLGPLNFDIGDQESTLNLTYLELSDDETTIVEEVDIECWNDSSNSEDPVVNIIDSCINYGVLQVARVDLPNEASSFVRNSTRFEIDEITNIFLKIDESDFLLKLDIGMVLKIKGSLTRSESVVDLHIKSAKVLFVSVKGEVLDLLKDLESDKITLQEDHLLISLD